MLWLPQPFFRWFSRLPWVRRLSHVSQASLFWGLLFFGGGGVGVVVAQVTSVTGTTPLTCSPTTGSVVCTTVGSIAQNLVLASPNGASGNAAFRALAVPDLPASGATPGSYVSSNVTVNTAGLVTAISNGTNATLNFPIGWSAGVNPNSQPVVTNLPNAISISAISGRIEAGVGQAATVAVAAAPVNTSCAHATSLSAGGGTPSLNANISPIAGNQNISVTTATVPSLASLCLQTTGFSGSSTGIGTITVYATQASTVTSCTLAGSALGTNNGGQTCTSFIAAITGDSGGSATWTLCGTNTQQICRNGTVDSVTGSVVVLLFWQGNLYQFNGTNWYIWNTVGFPTWPPGGAGYTVLSPNADPRP